MAQAESHRVARADPAQELRLVGLAGLNTGNLMPANFLIDERSRIIEACRGDNTGDRIPIERIEQFLNRRQYRGAT